MDMTPPRSPVLEARHRIGSGDQEVPNLDMDNDSRDGSPLAMRADAGRHNSIVGVRTLKSQASRASRRVTLEHQTSEEDEHIKTMQSLGNAVGKIMKK